MIATDAYLSPHRLVCTVCSFMLDPPESHSHTPNLPGKQKKTKLTDNYHDLCCGTPKEKEMSATVTLSH